ncbi:uncharacterized protein LOC111125019 isoform X3 [Crassostrea virginica]
MPSKNKGRPKSGKTGGQGQKSSTKNDAPKSNTVEDAVDKGDGPELESESQEIQESKAALHEKEETRGVQPESDSKEGSQREQSEGKPNKNETEGSAKKRKKNKNKKQGNERSEVEKQVEEIENLSPQEKLWMNISPLCDGCPEPLINFFKKLANGNHWTFLKNLKMDEIEHVIDSIKSSDAQGASVSNQGIHNRLQVRDEQYHILEMNFNKCRNEMSALQNSIKREQEKCQKIAEDRDLFKDRFSKLAETKLTAGNAHIQDLSDLNRPQKLGEKLSELYDNEWTDAFESLQENDDLDEKMTVQKLLETFKTCVSFCQLKAEEQEVQLMNSVKNSVEFSSDEKAAELCNGTMEEQEQDVLTPRDTKMFKDFLKAKGMNSLSHLKRVFFAENPDCAAQGKPLQDFILSCLEVCWLSAIQDPPLAFDWNFPEGSDVTEKSVKPFTKSGSKVDYVVWPVMKLCAGGDIICKGVIQPIPEARDKKKNNT